MAELKIWIAKNINGGAEIKDRKLKSLCEKIGMNYSTAQKRGITRDAGKSGERFRWASEEVIYDIWMEKV